MKVQLTGERSKDDCVLYGVEFKKGKAELSKAEVDAGVFDNLLSRYYPVKKAGAKSESADK